ncbi:MAG: twin-arginine translocation signal domain-containing protein [Gemmatimonadetes bacterium]|nr:twin-arginine translocation signal domain-containing protein [Gemmatimonadota bacterium]
MNPERRPTRRNFIKSVGGAVGAAAIGSYPEELSAAPIPVAASASQAQSPFPELNDRSVGWLRFLWEKATTQDDWSRWGVPHPWWDQYSFPGVTSYPRFDLQYSTYAVLVMADQTPAWREVYTRIVDELATRYPTYWGAVDWLTQIGDDPARENYPPQFMNGIPEDLRGSYNRIGWTANGVPPWGLQEDPIGADGNLFYRGWFGLMLSVYRYVSGDDKWEQPFAVTGYEGQDFEWDHHRIVERLEQQYRDHPEGPHCENTKIWPFCNSAAGLGVYLYDRIHGTQRHLAVQNWLEYLKDNYMGVSDAGELEWFTSWYDPLVNHKANGGPSSGLGPAFLILPQDKELSSFIYEASANAAGWNNPRVPVRASSTGLLMAREMGDETAILRLSAAAERAYEPRFFGDHGEKFGWWFGLNDPYPRGQRSAMMMISEIGQGGDWTRAFEAPHMDKFDAPTVEGIDFPSMGVRQAWNDVASGTLYVTTYATTPDRRGVATRWRVTHLPDPDEVFVICDGEPFERFEVEGSGTIRIDSDIDSHRFQIFTGYRGGGARTGAVRRERPATAGSTASTASAGSIASAGSATLAYVSQPDGGNTGRTDVRKASSEFFADGGPTCSCC